LEELYQIANGLQTKEIKPEDLKHLGCRIITVDELIPDHERKIHNIEAKSQIHNKLAQKVQCSNKDNSYKAKK